MSNPIRILKIYPQSFRVNIYSKRPFRVIGIVVANIEYNYGTEKVALAYYRSSGTNSGKIKGLWYPIVGIKTKDGDFTEFSEYMNFVLSYSTRDGQAGKGWLCKSLFFAEDYSDDPKMVGYSNGKHYRELMQIGKALKYLYENQQYEMMDTLDSETLNKVLSADTIYTSNKHTQRGNFERLIEEIFMEDVYEEE